MKFMSAPLLLVVGILLDSVSVVGQGQGEGAIDEGTHSYLRSAAIATGLEVDNYRELQFLVEDFPDDIESTGLREYRVETRIELKMRSVGLRPQEADNPLSPTLYVRIGGVGDSFAIGIELNRLVNYYLDDPSSDDYLVRQAIGTTWNTARNGYHDGNAVLILEGLDADLDEFLNAYLVANQE